jgi:glycosyltransferase
LKVSVITAVFNNEDTIEEAIKSLSGQMYKDVEHIVVDGGSTDGTLDVIGRYRDKIAKIISEPDRGIYDALNKGIRLASGDVIGLLHGDDFYAHEKVLGTVLDVFEKRGVDSCYGDLQYVDKKDANKVIRYWKASQYCLGKFKFGWMPPHPTFFVKREIYEKYGLFNLALGSAADYELMLRFLVKHRITTAYIPEVLVKMRIGGKSNSSLRNRIRANRMDRMAWKVNDLKPYPWTLWMKPLRKIGQYFLRG